MGVGDVHPKHATFFPAASKSLHGSVWGRRKGGFSLNGVQGKEASSDRQCCFEQGTSSQLTRTQDRRCFMKPYDIPYCHRHFCCWGAGRELHCIEHPRIILPPKPTHLLCSWGKGVFILHAEETSVPHHLSSISN